MKSMIDANSCLGLYK